VASTKFIKYDMDVNYFMKIIKMATNIINDFASNNLMVIIINLPSDNLMATTDIIIV
jgi:hypothetical protein